MLQAREGRREGGREEQLLMGCIDLEIAVSLSFAIAPFLFYVSQRRYYAAAFAPHAADVERHLDARMFLTRTKPPLRTLAEQIASLDHRLRSRRTAGNPLFSLD